MKILLVSDTHGTNIDLISAYAEKAKAEICIHAGDFGFYDNKSVEAMSQRERVLLIRHSSLPEEEKDRLQKSSLKEQIQGILQHRLTGEFPDFLADHKRFGWPIYAVWGNHDDAKVVTRMMSSPIPNLHILHENIFIEFDEFVLLGLGGNCLPEKQFTRESQGIPGTQCRPESVLAQYTQLLRTATRIPKGKKKILVTHVSPLVEPFLELIAWQIGADFTISGHMGRKNGETGIMDAGRFHVLEQTYSRLLELYPEAAEELKTFRPQQSEQRIQHINLPDAADGYGILDYSNDGFNFEIRGLNFHARQEAKFGKTLFDLSNSVYLFGASEYSAMLPIADKIIKGELSSDDEVHYTDRMMHCLGYPKMSELLHKCCESIIKRNPEFAVLLLDDEHNMMEGKEAPWSEELRKEYELHRSHKSLFSRKFPNFPNEFDEKEVMSELIWEKYVKGTIETEGDAEDE